MNVILLLLVILLILLMNNDAYEYMVNRTYGGLNLIYNNEPNTPNFNYINNSSEGLRVGNALLLNNKDIYSYYPTLASESNDTDALAAELRTRHSIMIDPKFEGILDEYYRPKLDLLDSTYYCDEMTKKRYNYNNQHGLKITGFPANGRRVYQEKEVYFD